MSNDQKNGGAPDSAPATLAQLRAAFADNPEFVIECLEQKRGMIAAYAANQAQLTARLAAAEQKNAGLLKLGSEGADGVDPLPVGVGREAAASGVVGASPNGTGDAADHRIYDQAVDRNLRNGMSHFKAHSAASVQFPKAKQAWLANDQATVAQHGPARARK